MNRDFYDFFLTDYKVADFYDADFYYFYLFKNVDAKMSGRVKGIMRCSTLCIFMFVESYKVV